MATKSEKNLISIEMFQFIILQFTTHFKFMFKKIFDHKYIQGKSFPLYFEDVFNM